MRKNIFSDDKLDALAIAAAHWVESMSRDDNLSAEAHKADLLDKAFESSSLPRQIVVL
jgi:hypothetical protein